MGYPWRAAAIWRRLRDASPCLAGVAASDRRNTVDGRPISDAAWRELISAIGKHKLAAELLVRQQLHVLAITV